MKERERPYVKDFTLGGKNQKRKSQNTEVLFIERCIEFLKPGGRMGIVLPDSVLTNSSLQYVRDFCIEKAQILGVVSLPLGAFTHYGAGVKASSVFLRKYSEAEKIKEDYPIFMVIAEHIGYDTTGRPDKNEFPKILESWRGFKKNKRSGFISERPLCFSIKLSALENALNPARYCLEIPGESKWCTLSACGEVVYEILQPSKYPQKVFDVIRIDDLENDCYEVTKLRSLFGKDLKAAYQVVRPSDVLVTRLGPGILNRKSLVCPATTNTPVASTELIVFRTEKSINPWGILAILKTKLFVSLMYSKGRGATPSRFRLSREDFKQLPFPSLTQSEIDSIGKEFLEQRNKAKSLRSKAQRLIEDMREKAEKIALKK